MANPTCPGGCASSLGPVSFSLCSPEINLSEVAYIYMGAADIAPFTDWEDVAEWTTKLDQSVTTPGKIRTLTVIGDKPAPTSTARTISGGRTVNTGKTHIVNFTVDETNDINHEWLRQIECGGKFTIWYETKSGHIFGGNEGIEASITADMVLARGDEEIAVYNGAITWKSKFTEERAVSPVAH